MNRTTSRRTSLVGGAAVILATAAVLLIATGAFGGGSAAPNAPSPSAPPTPSPTVASSPVVTPAPSPSQPVDHPPIEGDVTIDLDTATGHDVKATVRDESGRVVGVRSGSPGDGMSVRWGEVRVENIDVRTIRIVWAGLAIDDVVHIAVSRDGRGYLVDMVQTAPLPNTDAVGYDRIVEVTFDRDVRAADVEAAIAERAPAL